MDKLNLLHPSLGMAFTDMFKPRGMAVIHGNLAEDNLPFDCDGCRENLAGDPICCLGSDEE